jgi:hypothetical protein
MHGPLCSATLDGASVSAVGPLARESVMGDKPANKPATAAEPLANTSGVPTAPTAPTPAASALVPVAAAPRWNARQMAQAIRATVPGSTVDDKRVRGWVRANIAQYDDDGYTSHSYDEATATVILAAFVAMAAKRSGTATDANGTVRIPGVKPAPAVEVEVTPDATEATDDAPAS